MFRRKKSGARFTLVELLVVVSIISVLAAMLLPVLNQAIGSARQASCAGNQRQIALAFEIYLGDYGGFYPKSYLCEYGFYFSNQLYSAINSDKPLAKPGTCSCGKHGAMNNYIGFCNRGCLREANTIFHCLAQKISPISNAPEFPVSYAMSWFLGGATNYSSTSWTQPYLPQTAVTLPSQGMLVMDGGWLYHDSWTWVNFFLLKDVFGANGGIHSKGINVLFGDGHVKHLPGANILTERTCPEGKAFWEGVR